MTIIWLLIFAVACIAIGIGTNRAGGPGWLSMIFYVAAGALGIVVIVTGVEMFAGPFPGLHRY